MKSPERPHPHNERLAHAEADLRRAFNLDQMNLPPYLKIASVYKEMEDLEKALDKGDLETLKKYASGEIRTAIGVSHLVQAYLDALEK